MSPPMAICDHSIMRYVNRVTMKMKSMPKMVSPIIVNELWVLWASGNRSLAPIYKMNPPKNPRYNVNK